MSSSPGQNSQAQALIPYTGFYIVDATTNAFVMVDTHEVWAASQTGGQGTSEYFGTITLCPDGVTSNKYEIGSGASFDGTTLTIPDGQGGATATLSFASTTSGVSISGTIDGAQVAGTTPFGPVQLSLWTGVYYQQGDVEHHGGLLHYPYTPALQVNADGSMLYTTIQGGEMQPVPSYWYDYGMFVIGLMDIGEPENAPKLYEMGTSSGWGRVAGDASTGVMLVSLPLQQPAPHL